MKFQKFQTILHLRLAILIIFQLVRFYIQQIIKKLKQFQMEIWCLLTRMNLQKLKR